MAQKTLELLLLVLSPSFFLLSVLLSSPLVIVEQCEKGLLTNTEALKELKIVKVRSSNFVAPIVGLSFRA